jgi:site-specific DNA-adenine methylase
MNKLPPPFPWFGGKRRIAPIVWSRMGKVRAFCEPFIGAGAVFLARPDPVGMETINDLDGLVVNFWRSVQMCPLAVKEAFQCLLSEVDLKARHKVLHDEVDADRLLVEGPVLSRDAALLERDRGVFVDPNPRKIGPG